MRRNERYPERKKCKILLYDVGKEGKEKYPLGDFTKTNSVFMLLNLKPGLGFEMTFFTWISFLLSKTESDVHSTA